MWKAVTFDDTDSITCNEALSVGIGAKVDRSIALTIKQTFPPAAPNNDTVTGRSRASAAEGSSPPAASGEKLGSVGE
tara:strand:- start:525 stop:755 length:231 start_codon:yes stop_codon:yes gene_type:complete